MVLLRCFKCNQTTTNCCWLSVTVSHLQIVVTVFCRTSARVQRLLFFLTNTPDHVAGWWKVDVFVTWLRRVDSMCKCQSAPVNKRWISFQEEPSCEVFSAYVGFMPSESLIEQVSWHREPGTWRSGAPSLAMSACRLYNPVQFGSWTFASLVKRTDSMLACLMSCNVTAQILANRCYSEAVPCGIFFFSPVTVLFFVSNPNLKNG